MFIKVKTCSVRLKACVRTVRLDISKACVITWKAWMESKLSKLLHTFSKHHTYELNKYFALLNTRKVWHVESHVQQPGNRIGLGQTFAS